MFQSPNGFIGLSAIKSFQCPSNKLAVSIPKRVHRPFSRRTSQWKRRRTSSFNPQTGSSAFQPRPPRACMAPRRWVSIPKRVHRPFSRSHPRLSPCRRRGVSIPKRVHRPFSPLVSAMSPARNGVSIPKRVHRPFSRGRRQDQCR